MFYVLILKCILDSISSKFDSSIYYMSIKKSPY